jgi:hypothetical protein
MNQWEVDQIDGLQRLAAVLKQSEVNFKLVPPAADMAYIEMVDTPYGPHAIYDPHSQTYDIWNWGRKRPGMKYSHLSAEDAAEILATAYFIAKAKRIRKHSHRSIDEIMKILRQGYQGRAATPPRTNQ